MRVSSSIAIAYETVSPPAPPCSSGIGQAHETQLGELGDELVRETAFEIELRGHGCDAFPRERPHGLANQLLLGREVEVHAARILAGR